MPIWRACNGGFVYRTDEQLEDVGRDFLRRLGLEHQVRPDPMTIITKLKHAVPRFKYRRVPDRDIPQASWHITTIDGESADGCYCGRGDPGRSQGRKRKQNFLANLRFDCDPVLVIRDC